jgi:hypothetical protein
MSVIKAAEPNTTGYFRSGNEPDGIENIKCFFKFHLIVGVEESIVNTLPIHVTDHGSAVLILRFIRSQSTLQRLLRGEIKKKHPIQLTIHLQS